VSGERATPFCIRILSEKGIPLSSYFVPNGFDEVFSELSADEKNKISHRGNAMKKIAKILKKL